MSDDDVSVSMYVAKVEKNINSKTHKLEILRR